MSGTDPHAMTPSVPVITHQQNSSRAAFWADFINRHGFTMCAEIGVWKGDFARAMLAACPAISAYWLIDPWRKLPNWEKPCNVSDEDFESVYREALAATEEFAAKRRVLRGTTADVINEIPDGTLDFVYIDGDHTLRGITIDMILSWPKVRDGGAIGGDDCVASAWQHGPGYEPTFVRPWVIYFAEAMRAPLTLLPGNQFLIRKCDEGFSLTDSSGSPPDYSVAAHLAERAGMIANHRAPLATAFGSLKKLIVKTLRRVSPRFREADSRRRFGDFPREITETGWLFIHVPKTAGSSFSLALYGRAVGHATLAEWQNNYPLSTPSLRTVAIVRDPVERFWSAFDYLAAGGMNATDVRFAREVLGGYRTPTDFARALLSPTTQARALHTGFHFRRQIEFLRNEAGRVAIDFLIPYARLHAATRRMTELLGRPFQLPAVNRTARRSAELAPDAREIVELLYADDVRLYREALTRFDAAGQEMAALASSHDQGNGTPP